MSEETTKYQKHWKDYKNRQSDGCLLGLIIIPAVVAIIVVSRNDPAYSNALAFVIFVIIGGLILLRSFNYISDNDWKCPRCQQDFDYSKRRFVKNCINCGLPIYYGSSYFYDQWGTEQGNELAQKVKDGKI